MKLFNQFNVLPRYLTAFNGNKPETIVPAISTDFKEANIIKNFISYKVIEKSIIVFFPLEYKK